MPALSAAFCGRLSPAILVAVVGLAASGAHAQTWDGAGTTNNWTDLNNWSGNPPPVSSNSTFVFFGLSSRLTSVNDIAPTGSPFQLFNLTFTGAAGAYQLSGREIQFVGGSLFYDTASNISIANNLSVAPGFGGLSIVGTGTGTVSLTGNITSASLAKNGSYTLLLSGTNAITGSITVGNSTTNGGVLGAASNAALGTTTSMSLGAGSTYRVLGTFAQTRSISNQGSAGGVVEIGAGLTLTQNGAVTGTQFTKTGAGTLILGGTNTFNQAFSIQGGLVQAALASQMGSAAGTINLLNGATLKLTGAFNLTRTLAVGAGGGTLELAAAGTTNLGALTGAGALTKIGPGTLNLTGVVGNSISGGMNINGGVVQTAASASTGTGPVSIANDATLRLNTGWFNGSAFTMGAGGGRIDVPTGFATHTGTLDGTTLRKVGTGRLDLNGTGTLSGGILLNEGELRLGGTYTGPQFQTLANTTLGGHGGKWQGDLRVGGVLGQAGADTRLQAQTLQVDSGAALKFEFQQAGSPTYAGATPVNDVLRLTGSTPFDAPLPLGAAIDLYLNTSDPVAGADFRGGIFTDSPADFASQLALATVNVFVKDPSGLVSYGGVTYSPLALAYTLSTVPDSADFSLVSGRVMQLSVAIPAPGALTMLGLGGLAATRRRRR